MTAFAIAKMHFFPSTQGLLSQPVSGSQFGKRYSILDISCLGLLFFPQGCNFSMRMVKEHSVNQSSGVLRPQESQVGSFRPVLSTSRVSINQDARRSQVPLGSFHSGRCWFPFKVPTMGGPQIVTQNIHEYVRIPKFKNTSRNKVHRDPIRTSPRKTKLQIGQTPGWN